MKYILLLFFSLSLFLKADSSFDNVKNDITNRIIIKQNNLIQCIKQSDDYKTMYYCNKNIEENKQDLENLNKYAQIFTNEKFINLKTTLVKMLKSNLKIEISCIQKSKNATQLQYCIPN